MGFKFMGIEFEKTSLRQVLEALAIFQWSVIFGYGGIVVSLILFVLLFTPFAVVSLALWAWMIYDYRTPERGGRRWEWVRDWKVWKLCRDYFPVSLIPTAKLDPARNYLLVYHPHGILSYGAFANFGTNAGDFNKLFPGLRATILGLKIQFLCPLIRDYFMAFGGCACSRDSIQWLLTRKEGGNAVVLVVGGASEALDAHQGTYDLTLKQRKGFVKLAIQAGTPLVPVFAFGENDVFQQVANPPGSRLRRFQTAMSKLLSFSPPIFHGRGIFSTNFGILPYRRPIDVVVGSPLEVKQISEPSEEEVNAIHERYIEHLVRLFEDNKTKFGVPSDKHIKFV